MSVQISTVNVGSVANDGTGDNIREAFIKVNNNTGNLTVAVNNLQATSPNTTFGVFQTLSVTDQVIGNIYLTGSDTIYVNGSPVSTGASSFNGGNVALQTKFNDVTNSTSPTIGAVTVAGGVGIGLSLSVGGTSKFSGDMTIQSITDSTGLGAGSFVSNGGASIGRTVRVGEQLFVTGNAFMSNALSISSSYSSTSTTTGALVVSGGVGVAGNVNIGGNVTVGGLSGYGAGFANMQVYTGNGTWTIPAGVQRWKVTVIGGGGGGGSSTITNGSMGGGGASGGVVVGYYNYVAGQSSMNIVVGTNGTGGTGANGVSGGNTTTTYNAVTYTATGGAGGLISSQPSTAVTGGTGSGGALQMTGGTGGPNGINSATTIFVNNGGSTPMGFGFGGVYGGVGVGYGAGGAGGITGNGGLAVSGSNGTSGAVIVEF